MKNLTLITALILSFLSSGLAQESASLTVEIQGLKSDKGQLMVGLYNSEGTWLAKGFKGEVSKIVDGTATVVFSDVPHGQYAISSYHDENSNDKLDTGWFGIPKEPYACSEGAKGNFGPPKWVDAVFIVNQDSQTTKVKF